jgi:hypothetical protein
LRRDKYGKIDGWKLLMEFRNDKYRNKRRVVDCDFMCQNQAFCTAASRFAVVGIMVVCLVFGITGGVRDVRCAYK